MDASFSTPQQNYTIDPLRFLVTVLCLLLIAVPFVLSCVAGICVLISSLKAVPAHLPMQNDGQPTCYD
jgi:hypothetical protein